MAAGADFREPITYRDPACGTTARLPSRVMHSQAVAPSLLREYE